MSKTIILQSAKLEHGIFHWQRRVSTNAVNVRKKPTGKISLGFTAYLTDIFNLQKNRINPTA